MHISSALYLSFYLARRTSALFRAPRPIAMAVPGSTVRSLQRTVLTAPALARMSVPCAAHPQLRRSFLKSRPSPLAPASSSPMACSQIRHSSYNSPEHASNATSARKKVTLQTIRSLYKKGEPIAMLTAHDFPSAHVADAAGMDVVLVGDSLGMVALGLDNTTEVIMEEMILHCRSVARGAKSAFIVSWRKTSVDPRQTLTRGMCAGRRFADGVV